MSFIFFGHYLKSRTKGFYFSFIFTDFFSELFDFFKGQTSEAIQALVLLQPQTAILLQKKKSKEKEREYGEGEEREEWVQLEVETRLLEVDDLVRIKPGSQVKSTKQNKNKTKTKQKNQNKKKKSSIFFLLLFSF